MALLLHGRNPRNHQRGQAHNQRRRQRCGANAGVRHIFPFHRKHGQTRPRKQARLQKRRLQLRFRGFSAKARYAQYHNAHTLQPHKPRRQNSFRGRAFQNRRAVRPPRRNRAVGRNSLRYNGVGAGICAVYVCFQGLRGYLRHLHGCKQGVQPCGSAIGGGVRAKCRTAQ